LSRVVALGSFCGVVPLVVARVIEDRKAANITSRPAVVEGLTFVQAALTDPNHCWREGIRQRGAHLLVAA
jgi:hypothetical protein